MKMVTLDRVERWRRFLRRVADIPVEGGENRFILEAIFSMLAGGSQGNS
jgi:hypothetical protein